MNKYIQIITTTSSKEEANKIANTLIEKKIAACVQILGPIESIYKWKGKIEKANEFLCLIKTKADKEKEIVFTIKSLHSYEIPEIIVMPIIGGNEDYLNWIEKEIK
jgi:periplasmic divalent cation tolerance protein